MKKKPITVSSILSIFLFLAIAFLIIGCWSITGKGRLRTEDTIEPLLCQRQ